MRGRRRAAILSMRHVDPAFDDPFSRPCTLSPSHAPFHRPCPPPRPKTASPRPPMPRRRRGPVPPGRPSCAAPASARRCSTRWPRHAPERPASVFDVCHVGVVLRAVLFVHARAWRSACCSSRQPPSSGWSSLPARLGVALPAVLLWLLGACALKRPLGAAAPAVQWAGGLGARRAGRLGRLGDAVAARCEWPGRGARRRPLARLAGPDARGRRRWPAWCSSGCSCARRPAAGRDHRAAGRAAVAHPPALPVQHA